MPNITVSRIQLAENLIKGVQYLSRREVLNELSSDNSSFTLTCNESPFQNSLVDWIKIDQVGACHEYTTHQYYSVIQKVLFSCHLPEKVQIIFLIHGDGEKVNLYLGIKRLDESSAFGSDDMLAENITMYLNTLLPGSKAKYIEDLDKVGNSIVDEINDKKYRYLYALSGIPSMIQKEGEENLDSINTLIGPLSRKRFVYYVVADPVNEYDVNDKMIKCLEMAGKIESVKSYNISETDNTSVTIGSNNSFSETITESNATAVNRKGKKHHFWCKCMSTIGLGDFIDQSTNTITNGISRGNSHAEINNNTQGFSTTKSMTLVNKCAEHAANNMSLHAKRYENGLALGMWNVGVYLLSDESYVAQNAAMQLRSIVSGVNSSLEPIRIHNISYLLKAKGISSNMLTAISSFSSLPIVINTLDGNSVKSNFDCKNENITTCLTTEELSSFINLPQKSVPGISVVENSFDFSLTPQKDCNSTNIDIGQLLYSGVESNINVYLPLDTLSRHALVCGVNGSGKTNTVLSVLDGFMKAYRPFFVIEPAKTEYVDWAIEYNKTVKDPKKKIKIFIPGCERYAKGGITPDKLQLNPFEVINLPNSEMRVLSHIDRLKATFASAFPMQDILPVIMEHLLYKLYTDKHQMLDKDDKANYMKKGFPTLTTVNAPFIDELMSDIGYAKENTQNISAALRTRFQSLKYGWKNELLNNEKLSGKTWNNDKKAWENNEMTWEELFGSPVVVNLSYAGDDQDRAFIMSLLLQFLYDYRIAESETGKVDFNSNKCRHLVVVEEAHRVMANCLNPELPQYKSGQMFSNFLSEVRAYGQGMMVVDQVPTRLIEDAIKNTNVKIIHKLVASDDSQRIAECIGLTPEQQKVIAKLSIGQAVLAGFNSANVGSSDSSDIYLAQINKMK